MSFVPDLAQSCRENDELIADLARFSEGLCSEAAVRRKYRDLLDNEAWAMLGTDDLLVEMIEAEKVGRLRNGSAKRELAQKHIVRGPNVLAGIMDNPLANDRHKVDAIKALDQLAANGPNAAPEQDRFVIRIDLTAGGGEVLEFDKTLRPKPNDEVIDSTPQELPPPKRGPGRPKGSRNKPKAPQEMLPLIASKQTPNNSSGTPL